MTKSVALAVVAALQLVDQKMELGKLADGVPVVRAVAAALKRGAQAALEQAVVEIVEISLQLLVLATLSHVVLQPMALVAGAVGALVLMEVLVKPIPGWQLVIAAEVTKGATHQSLLLLVRQGRQPTKFLLTLPIIMEVSLNVPAALQAILLSRLRVVLLFGIVKAFVAVPIVGHILPIATAILLFMILFVQLVMRNPPVVAEMVKTVINQLKPVSIQQLV